MADIDVDVALLPVSGTYVMTAGEAAEACHVMKAKVVIPMHYGEVAGIGRRRSNVSAASADIPSRSWRRASERVTCRNEC